MEQNTTQQMPQASTRILKQLNSSFDFKRMLGALLSNWYWFVLAISITMTAGFLYLRYTTPIYSIDSSILIDNQDDNNVAQSVLTELAPDKDKSRVNLYNEKVILESQDMIAKVVDSLDLNIRYWAIGRVKETEIYEECPIKVLFDTTGFQGRNMELTIKQIVDGQFELIEGEASERVLYDTWIKRPWGRFKIIYNDGRDVNKGYLDATPFLVKIKDMSDAVGAVSSSFEVYLNDGRNSLLDLSYTDNIRQRGVDFLNVLIHYYRKNELESINHRAKKTREFINDRKANMIQELKSMDSLSVDIQLTNDIVNPTAQTTKFITEKAQSENEIQLLNMKINEIRALINNMQNGAGSRNEVIAGLTIGDASLNGLVGQYNAQVKKLEQLARNYGPSHPTLLELESQIAAMRKSITDASLAIEKTINRQLANAAQNAREAEDKLRVAPNVDNDIKDATRNYPVLQSIYLFLYQKGVENEISEYAATNKSKVVVVPYASSQPIEPVSNSIYVMMILLGLLVPGTFIVARELMNNSIINDNDIEAITDIPVLGSVGRVEEATNRDNTIVVGPHIRTGVAEQFRLIRANLEFMASAKDSRVFMITSSSSGEGKSFISINLGVTMTLAKRRVVIMEFDLRKPKISQYLGLPNNGGISGYLAGMTGLEGVLKASGIHENLYIANCGPIPPNPGELLVSGKMQQLMADLKEMFDVVIIDTAPIGLVSDALILSQHANVNLFIVRQSFTAKDQVRMFDVLHKDGKIQNPAIIFNGVEFLKKYGYGYGSGSGYGYSYGYGYGYGYVDNSSKKKKPNFITRFFTKK
ncbi:MAG: polysaccharide biosynthesis tyrosine autokinase [Flavipsychrobacter sp.]